LISARHGLRLRRYCQTPGTANQLIKPTNITVKLTKSSIYCRVDWKFHRGGNSASYTSI